LIAHVGCAASAVALVTVASSGIGKEIAKNLIDENYIVYVAARRIEKMSDLEAKGAIPVRMDIAVAEDISGSSS